MSSDVEILINSILEEAKKEAHEILERAREEANRIIRTAEEKARTEAERRAREVIDTERRRMLDAEIRKIREEKVILKSEIINKLQSKILKLVEDKIRGQLRGFDYYEFLYKLIRGAVLELGESEIIISANARDLEFLKSRKDEIKRKIREEVGIDVNIEIGEKIDAIGGVIIKSKNGDKTFNAVLDTLVKRMISLNTKKIVKYLGLISQNRFEKLIHKVFSKIANRLEIEASNGKKAILHPCENIYKITTESGRIDLVCDSGDMKTAVYATLGKATTKKIEEFMNAINSKLTGRNVQKIFIAFSGADEGALEPLLTNNIALITRNELFKIDRQIGSRVFE